MQCGFCTPGFLLTSLYLLREGVDLEDEAELREALSGNLCRCTGYQNIVDAVRHGAALLAQGDTPMTILHGGIATFLKAPVVAAGALRARSGRRQRRGDRTARRHDHA